RPCEPVDPDPQERCAQTRPHGRAPASLSFPGFAHRQLRYPRPHVPAPQRWPGWPLGPWHCAFAGLLRERMSCRRLQEKLVQATFPLQCMEVVAPTNMIVINEYLREG